MSADKKTGEEADGGRRGPDFDFDDVLENIGGFGKYQKRLLYVLLGPLCLIMPLPLLHQVSVLQAPAHSCMTNDAVSNNSIGLSHQAWEDVVFAKKLNAYGMMASDQCEYFDYDQNQIAMLQMKIDEIEAMNSTERDAFAADFQSGIEPVRCTAWSYDKSVFQDTAVTENDWVCDKGLYVANLYTLSTVGMIIGICVLSSIADAFGRKTGFYIGLAGVIIFTLLQIPTSHNYIVFALFKVLATLGMIPIFQSPFSILTEISTVDSRGWVLCFACLAWSLGQILFPFIGWLIATYSTWKVLKAISVLPLVFFYFAWRYLPESPRWMITKGKKQAATKILSEISEFNGLGVPADLSQKVEQLCNVRQEKTLGYLSLFSSPSLIIKTIIMTIGFTASGFIYYQITINVGNMHGNTFVNLFLLGLVEGPGNVLGYVASNKFGRRWVHCILLFINAVLFAAILPIVYYTETTSWAGPLLSFFCMIIKMNIAATFLVAYVQAMELYPTPIRSSGLGFCSFTSQIIQIGGPHIVYLGVIDIKIPYLVMCGICLVASICVSLLPETLGTRLPETLEDAEKFALNKFGGKSGYQAPSAQDKVDRI